MNSISETEILKRCQKGDKHAFGLLVNRFKKKAYFSALGFVHNRERALDLSQEAFVKTWRSIKKLDPNRKFFTWYYSILKNVCLNDIRKHKSLPRPYSEISDINIEDIQDHSTDISGSLEQNELKKVFWEAINQLTKNDQEIIMLREFQDFSYIEISEALDCPLGTVMSRLYSARQALKEKLKDYL